MSDTVLADAPPIDTARLERALTGWLPGQRWYAGKDRPLRTARVVEVGAVTSHGMILLVEAEYADGGPGQLYQVPVAVHPAPRPPDGGHVIAVQDDESVIEGMSDGTLVRELLHLVAGEREHPRLAFRSEPRCAAWPPPGRVAGCRPLGVEQSNTSVVADERYVLKVFRQLHTGTNPELELTRALRAAGNPHTAPLYGAVETELSDGPVTLAVVQGFLPGAADGWTRALAAVREGRDFAEQAYAMGGAVAAVHRDLAARLGSRPMDEEHRTELGEAFRTRLEQALAHVPELAPYAADLRAAYADLADLPPGPTVQRVHGDLHLGQLLCTGARWTVIDFEGEPSCAMSLRAERHSPLRDVAGMLRSFDYAAAHGAAPDWARASREAFCRGYADTSGTDPHAQEALLRAYTLDKAVYETAYERRNRPDWLHIPLAAIARLTGRDPAPAPAP
ncbi:maltokinase N-terminal cap-like domain-containing protein [Streptomyces sp. SCPE 10]